MIKDKKLFGYIYCATSPSNKKYYGKTINTVESRKDGHKKDKDGKTVFYCAIKKYGFDNFIWTIIEEYCVVLTNDLRLDKIELNDILCEREKYWIKTDKTYLREFGYNGTMGGDGVIGHIYTSEEKLAISKRISGAGNPNFGGRLMTTEVKNKIRNTLTGTILKEETKEKIKTSVHKHYSVKENRDKCGRSGKENPMYGKYVYDIWAEKYGEEIADEMWIKKGIEHSNKMSGTGNPMSGKSVHAVWVEKFGKEEADNLLKKQSAKRSKSLKGKLHKPMSEEGKRNISIAAKNRPPVSEQTKQKLKEARKRYEFNRNKKQ